MRLCVILKNWNGYWMILHFCASSAAPPCSTSITDHAPRAHLHCYICSPAARHFAFKVGALKRKMEDAFGFSSLLTPMVQIETIGQWVVSTGVPLYVLVHSSLCFCRRAL